MAIPNPAANDPNLHPNEVQFVEPVLHTVNLNTGDHTIEPLDDQQLRTAAITGYGPQNPQGEIHVAGSVQLEVEPDRIVLESQDRRKDAGDPTDYRTIQPLPGAFGLGRTDPCQHSTHRPLGRPPADGSRQHGAGEPIRRTDAH